MAAKTENGVRWITIHPNHSEKGVHVQVNGEHEVVGGNPHLVAALNGGAEEPGEPGDGGGWTPPTDEEFGGLFEGWEPPKETDNAWFVEDEPKSVEAPKPEEQPNKPFSFKDEKEKMFGWDHYKAENTLKGFFSHVFRSVEKAAEGVMKKIGANDINTLLKIQTIFKKSTHEKVHKSLINAATTVSHLKTILQEGAIPYNQIGFLATRTKGGGLSSYLVSYDDKAVGLVCLSPVSDMDIYNLSCERSQYLHNGVTPFNVASRYPMSDVDYVVCCHELAHAAYDKRKLKDEWKVVVMEATSQGFKFNKGVSGYAWHCKKFDKRINEAHSECFAMMAHPSYKRGTLPKVIETYFDINFFA